MTRKTLSTQEIYCFTTKELLDEIKRRSLGCMIVSVRVEARGDIWRYALKGSPVLLGAMSAALDLETRRSLAEPDGPPETVAI